MNGNLLARIMATVLGVFLVCTGGLVDASTGENSAAFARAAEENTIEAYREFLRMSHEGMYATRAREGIETIRYCQARLKGTEKTYLEFLEDFPDSRFSQEIRGKVIQLEVLKGALSGGTGIMAGVPKGKEDVEKEGTFHFVNNSGTGVKVYGVAENNFEFLLASGEQKEYSLKGYVTMVFKSSDKDFETVPLVAYAGGKDHQIELSLEQGKYSGKLLLVETLKEPTP